MSSIVPHFARHCIFHIMGTNIQMEDYFILHLGALASDKERKGTSIQLFTICGGIGTPYTE